MKSIWFPESAYVAPSGALSSWIEKQSVHTDLKIPVHSFFLWFLTPFPVIRAEESTIIEDQ